jgi:hypothetical protein
MHTQHDETLAPAWPDRCAATSHHHGIIALQGPSCNRATRVRRKRQRAVRAVIYLGTDVAVFLSDGSVKAAARASNPWGAGTSIQECFRGVDSRQLLYRRIRRRCARLNPSALPAFRQSWSLRRTLAAMTLVSITDDASHDHDRGSILEESISASTIYSTFFEPSLIHLDTLLILR